MTQKFPTWWQALILVVGGVVIGFSSCVGALSGIGAGRPSPFAQFYVLGFFAGIVAFILGIVLFIVVAIVALVRGPQEAAVVAAPHAGAGGVVISRATRPDLFPDALARATAPQSQEVQAALARLHIAIFVALLASGFSIWRLLALQQQHWAYMRHYSLISALSIILSQLPYVIVLIRTWRGPDRVGLALAIAAGFVYVLSTWRFFTNWQYRPLDPTFWVHAALNVLIIVLAYLVRGAAGSRKADAELLISFFFGVLVYTALITAAVRFLSFAWH